MGGTVGYSLAEALAAHHDIFVIDPQPERGEHLAQLDVEFVPGSGTDPEVLRRASIERADLLIAATDLDEVNIVACSIGHQPGQCGQPAGVQAGRHRRALSARGAAVASVIHRMDSGRSSLLAVLEGGRARVVELTVPGGYPTTALRDLALPRDSIVSTLLRRGEVVAPGGRDEVRAGDRLLICCTDAAAAASATPSPSRQARACASPS